MKHLFVFSVCAAIGFFSTTLQAQTVKSQTTNHLYLDVHHLGKVTAKDGAAAHKKDLAVEKKYGVQFLKYWVDENNGDVYCLASSPSADDTDPRPAKPATAAVGDTQVRPRTAFMFAASLAVASGFAYISAHAQVLTYSKGQPISAA